MITQEERAYLWLCACSRLEYREKVALLRAAPLAELFPRLAELSRSVLGREIAAEGCERAADGFVRSLEEKGYFALTLLSDDYPEQLKHIPSPPLVLYGTGNRALLRERMFCIVGSRIIPAWAEKTGRRIAEQLSRRFVIVTGLAEGGDLAAVEGALPGGNLISVLPCGLDECYPAAHASVKEKIKRGGLLLSELLPGEQTRKYSFHARNRILAGLCEGVLVLSAGKKSGALITAYSALDCGRDVFALPHNAGASSGEGCNELIKKGAALVTEAQDILDWYGMEAPASAEIALTAEEQRILELLRAEGEIHFAALAERAGIKPFEASAVLSALEIKGLAVKSGGNKYSAV